MNSVNFVLSALAMVIVVGADNVTNPAGGDFAITFEGFFPLVDRDYRLKSVRSELFKKTISLSMYRYYMAQHLYARLALILRERNITDANEEKFIKLVYAASPLLPRPIFDYLNSIGDITLNSTNVLKYAFLIWPNEEGHFGKVDGTNHWKYMSFPAPLVVAQAIQEDYSYTGNQSSMRNSLWNLRTDLIPQDVHSNRSECGSPGYPTKNLLGWKPFTELTLEQRQILQSSLITDRVFDTADSKFYTNPELLENIYTVLSELSNVFYFKDVGPTIYSSMISNRISQLGWIVQVVGEDASFSRIAAHIDRTVVGYTLNPFKKREATQVLVMEFRVLKTRRTTTWSIFEWSKYKCVPEDWIDTRNSVFFFFNTTMLVDQIFSSENRDAIRRNFLGKRRKFVKVDVK